MSRVRIARQWLQIVLGLLVFAFGVHLTIFANIGLAPWDCLGMGIARHTPLNYGLSMTVMSLLVLGIDLLLKEKIGYGTVIDALLTGNFVQMFNDLNPFKENRSVPLGVALMLVGFVFMALGMYIYMLGGAVLRPPGFLAGRNRKAVAPSAHRNGGNPAVGGGAAGRVAAGRACRDRNADQYLRRGTGDAAGLQPGEV